MTTTTITQRRERLERVIDHIQLHRDHFDWNTWGGGLSYDRLTDPDAEAGVIDGEWCGTNACIAGWAAALAQADGYTACAYNNSYLNMYTGKQVRKLDVFTTARRWLGLDWNQAEELFFAEGEYFVDHPTRPVDLDCDGSDVDDVVANVREWADARGI